MSLDPAQQRLFTPIEVPHPPSGGANGKARLAAALMLRFDRERTNHPDSPWTEEVSDALRAVLLVVASGVYDSNHELNVLWQRIVERHRERDGVWTARLAYDLVHQLIRPYGTAALTKLADSLDSPDETTRAWTLELAWILRRRWLPSIRPRLFEAFGSLPTDHNEAMALAFAVSPNDEEFLRAAEAHSAAKDAGPYRDRLAALPPFASGLASGFRLGAVEARATALVLDELAKL